MKNGENIETLRKEEEQVLIRMAASVIVGFHVVMEIEDPSEREDEEMEIAQADLDLQQKIKIYSNRHQVDFQEAINFFVNEAHKFIESGQYDQEVEEMLIEDGDWEELVDMKTVH